MSQIFNVKSFHASSRFMQTYIQAAPVTGHGDILAWRDPASPGARALSTAESGAIVAFAQDATSGTDWTQSNLESSFRALSLRLAEGANGTLYAVATQVSDQALYMATRAPGDDAFSAFEAIPVAPWSGGDVTGFGLAFDASGQLFIAARSDDAGFGYCTLDSDGSWSGMQSVGDSPDPVLGEKVIVVMGSGGLLQLVVQGDVGAGLLYTASQNSPGGDFDNFRSNSFPTGTNADAFTLVQGKDGSATLLVFDPQKSWFFTRELSTGTGNFTSPVDLPQPEGGMTIGVVTRLQASFDAEGNLDFFFLDQSNELCHGRRLAQPDANGTTVQAPLPIATNTIHFAVGVDEDQRPELFVLSGAGALTFLVLDEEGEVWSQSPVRTTALPPQEVPSYRTSIEARGPDGVSRPGTKINIKVSSPCRLHIAGAAYDVTPDEGVDVSTNAAGRVNVVYAANKLYTPLLTVTAPDTDEPPAPTVIEANLDVQETLYGLDGDGLKNAQTADGNYLVHDSWRNDDDMMRVVASATARVMSLSQPQLEGDAGTTTNAIGRNACREARPGPAADRGRIDLARVPAESWTLDFSQKRPRCMTLSHEAARAKISAISLTAQTSAGWGWADVWEAITNKGAELVAFTVHTIADAKTKIVESIEAGIQFLVDGITYAWQATVEFVEQVFDAVAGFFARIEVAFEDFFEWLAYLFDWDDILRTHDAIVAAVNATFDATGGVASYFKSVVDASYDTLKGEVDGWFDSQVANLIGAQEPHNVEAGQSHDDEIYNAGIEHNLILSAVVDNLDSIEPSNDLTAWMARTDASEVFQPILDAIDGFETAFANSSNLEEIRSQFEAVINNPDDWAKQGLAALLRVTQLVVDVGLMVGKALFDALIAVVQTLIQSAQGLLNASWDIPLVSALYGQLTSTDTNPNGNDLTTLDLLSLIFAVPATALHKVIFKVAPFPDEASLQRFVSTYTGDNIVAWLGLQPPSAAAVASRTVPGPLPPNLDRTFGVIRVIGRAILTVFEPLLDLQAVTAGGKSYGAGNSMDFGTGETSNFAKSLDLSGKVGNSRFSGATVMSSFSLGVSWVMVGASIPVSAMTEMPAGSRTASQKAAIASWAFSTLGPAVDVVSCISNGVATRLVGKKGAILASVLAGVDAVLFIVQTTIEADEDQLDGLAVAGGVIGTIPGLLKFLRVDSIVLSTSGGSIVGLAIVDVICNAAAMGIEIGGLIQLADA